MRQEMEIDPQGRTVRAVSRQDHGEGLRGEPGPAQLWFGRDAKPDLMHRSLQQRRNAILGDCTQLKTDQDSYNENNPYGATIQLSFNFEEDIADGEHDTEYNPQQPPEDDD